MHNLYGKQKKLATIVSREPLFFEGLENKDVSKTYHLSQFKHVVEYNQSLHKLFYKSSGTGDDVQPGGLYVLKKYPENKSVTIFSQRIFIGPCLCSGGVKSKLDNMVFHTKECNTDYEYTKLYLNQPELNNAKNIKFMTAPQTQNTWWMLKSRQLALTQPPGGLLSKYETMLHSHTQEDIDSFFNSTMTFLNIGCVHMITYRPNFTTDKEQNAYRFGTSLSFLDNQTGKYIRFDIGDLEFRTYKDDVDYETFLEITYAKFKLAFCKVE